MNPGEIAVLFGALINIGGTSSYVLDTVRGHNKPNRMTFLMWSIAPVIGAAAGFVQGVTWAAVPVLVAALCPFAVFIASFVNPNSYWKLSRFDYFCGVLSLLALVLWWVTRIPNIAILFAIASDGIAGYPTLLKAWKYPDTESVAGYAAADVSALTSFLVLPSVSFASLAFPIYLVITNTALVFSIWRGRAQERMI